MADTQRTLTADEAAAQLKDTAFVYLDSAIHAKFSTADFASATRLVDRIAEAADAMNHHPDIMLSYGSVGVKLSSHDVGGVTSRDVELALRIAGLAADAAP